ncbi:MAG: hypothetical protein ACM32E_14515 [Gemmatimonadota bacterium]
MEDTRVHQHDVTGLTAELGDTDVRASGDGAVIEVTGGADPSP